MEKSPITQAIHRGIDVRLFYRMLLSVSDRRHTENKYIHKMDGWLNDVIGAYAIEPKSNPNRATRFSYGGNPLRSNTIGEQKAPHAEPRRCSATFHNKLSLIFRIPEGASSEYRIHSRPNSYVAVQCVRFFFLSASIFGAVFIYSIYGKNARNISTRLVWACAEHRWLSHHRLQFNESTWLHCTDNIVRQIKHKIISNTFIIPILTRTRRTLPFTHCQP